MIRRRLVTALLMLGAVAAARAARADAQPLLRSFDSVAISPDGRSVVSAESTDPGPAAVAPAKHRIVLRTSNGHVVTLGCPPHISCTLTAPVWSPDGSRIAYVVRDERSKRFAVWTVDAAGGSPHPWLRAFDGILGAPRWSSDGASLALLATAGAHKDIGATQAGAALTGEIAATLRADVQRIAILGPDRTLRFASPPDLFIYEYDWVPRARAFVATGAYGNGDDDWWVAKLYRVDGERRTARVLYAPKRQIDAPRVSPDGTRVAFISGLMSDFGSVGGDVYVMPVAGGAAVDVTPGMRATADAIAWNGSNRHLTFTGLAGDAAEVADIDVDARRITPRWRGAESLTGDGVLDVSLAATSPQTAVVRQTFERPPEIYRGPLGAWRPLTRVNAGLLPGVRARSISWNDEGFMVQGWLLAPRSVVAGRRYPMIVQVHGGPSAAARPRFAGRASIERRLAEHGYFVFLPNPRGSFGQGERFAAANVRDFGYGDLRDVLAGVDAVERIAPVDDRRLGLTGWSYGGFMTMFAVTQTQRFQAAFAGAGIADWQSYYGENGIDQWMIPFFGASVYDDPAVYAKSSPITFITRVRTPTAVVVGERDVECPAPQSMEFWHALAARGVPTSLVIYAGEGHGFRKPADRADVDRRELAWFARYLGSGAADAPSGRASLLRPRPYAK